MNAQTADAKAPREGHRHAAAPLALSMGLSVGLLDMASRLLNSTVVDVTVLALAPFVATAAFVWAASAVSAAALALLTNGIGRITRFFLTMTVFWGLLVPATNFCCPVADLLPDSPHGWLMLLLIVALAALASWKIGAALTATIEPSRRRILVLAPFAPPLVSAIALLWAIQHASWRTVPPVGLLFLTITIIVAATLLVLWDENRTKHATWTTRCTTLVALLAVFIPLAKHAGPRSSLAASPPADNPNPVRRVILLSVDTLRADALSCYGGDTPTPNIDAIARDSIQFERAISPAPWTLPAFASIMTGVYPAVHGATKIQSRVPLELTTLAERLHAAGYYTAAIGDNEFLTRDTNMSQGFVEYHFSSGIDARPTFGLKLLQHLFPSTYVGVATSRSLTNMACDWLERNADRRFFLWLHYFDPHIPYSPPREFMPSGAPPALMGASLDDRVAVLAGYVGRTAAERRWIRSLYLGEVRYVDACIGDVVAALKRLRIYEGTLLVFVSDHGEEFWEHGGFEHGHSLYDEVVHVPLLIKPPHVTADHRPTVSASVTTAALLPTVLDLCGISYDQNELSVQSLAPLLIGDAETPDVVYCDSPLYYQDRRAAIMGDTKYIWNALTRIEEVYDLASDPGELSSVAQSARAALRDGRASCDEYLRSSNRLREKLGLVPEKAALNAERLERLRSLGYVQ